MDWRMPGLDGWETSRRIRDSHASDAPVIIMVTAHGRDLLAERNEQEIDSLGGYLVKPVTASMLQDAVAEATHGVPRRRRAEGGAQRLTGLRLLGGEDNGFNQQVAQELLEDEGAVVRLAGGGVEGAHLALVTGGRRCTTASSRPSRRACRPRWTRCAAICARPASR